MQEKVKHPYRNSFCCNTPSVMSALSRPVCSALRVNLLGEPGARDGTHGSPRTPAQSASRNGSVRGNPSGTAHRGDQMDRRRRVKSCERDVRVDSAVCGSTKETRTPKVRLERMELKVREVRRAVLQVGMGR